MKIENKRQTTFDTSGVLKTTEIELDSHRIHGRNRLEKFLRGTKKCCTVAYVLSLDFIENYIEEIGIENLTIILGKEFSISKIKSLDPNFISKLASWRKEGVLTVRVPKKGIMHEKLFFCSNDEDGPTLPIPGPTLLIAEATELIEVRKSTPNAVIINEPEVKINRYKNMKASKL